MSETSVVFGRILCWDKAGAEKNLEVVSGLPSVTEPPYPVFTRDMFNRNLIPGKGDVVIGFARSYKNMEHHWEYWIEEFEKIIIQLQWKSIVVFLETEMYGTHQYFWQSKYSFNDPERPVKNDVGLTEMEHWYFGKGHRDFWGHESKIGWKHD